MDSIVDLAESRRAKQEKSELLKDASQDLLLLLEKQRQYLSEEFLTFLLAMAISDQALYFSQLAGEKKAGGYFIESLFNNARLLFEAHYPGISRPTAQDPFPAQPETTDLDEQDDPTDMNDPLKLNGQLLQFTGEYQDHPTV